MRTIGVVVMTLGACALAVACGPAAETPSSDTPAPAATPPAAPAVAPAPKMTDAERQALLASLPAPYNTGNLANGKTQFALCQSCHTIAEGGPNRTGPNLHGVFGRTAGTHEGFKYSDAVKAAGFQWDAEKLDAWLADPRGFLPGNRMSFVGVKDPQKRIDLIAYLKVETGYQPAN